MHVLQSISMCGHRQKVTYLGNGRRFFEAVFRISFRTNPFWLLKMQMYHFWWKYLSFCSRISARIVLTFQGTFKTNSPTLFLTFLFLIGFFEIDCRQTFVVFGRCRNKEPHSSGILLCSVVVVGYENYSFLPPIVELNSHKVNARSNTYACACVLRRDSNEACANTS